MSAINVPQIQVAEKPKGFLNWLKRAINKFNSFLGIIAIPLVTYCVAIIAWEITDKNTLTGMVVFSVPVGIAMDNIANALMNITVEACLFGCVGLAEMAKKNNDEKGEKKYSRIALSFAALSILTVGFKVLHLPPEWDPYLSWLRISACVVYALKCHPKDENEHIEQTFQARMEEKVNEIGNLFTEQFNRKLTASTEHFDRTLQNALRQISEGKSSESETLSELLEAKTELLRESMTELLEMKTELLNTSIMEQISEQMEGRIYQISEQITTRNIQLIEEKTSAVRNTVESTIKRLSPPPMPAPTTPTRTINSRPAKKEAQPVEPLSKKDFILMCLKDNPKMKNVEIISKGKEKGLTIAPSTVSEIRNGFITGVSEVNTDGKLEAVNVQQAQVNS
jgi:hypothetical protein